MTLQETHVVRHRTTRPSNSALPARGALALGILFGLFLLVLAGQDIPTDRTDVWHGNVVRSTVP
jgi:hypothetical protein